MVLSSPVAAEKRGLRVTALETVPERAPAIVPPPGLPSHASFAVSDPSEPVPTLARAERDLITEAMVPARRDALVRGRAAAHRALRAIGLDTGPILSGPNREPVWPSGATGAISHAAGSAVALVAPSTLTDGIGVDIETLRPAPELWNYVPRPEERAWIEQRPPGEQQAALLALFSAKESVFKAFFPRVESFFGFERAALTPTSSGFVARLTTGLDDAYPWGRTFYVSCGWFGDLVLTSVVLPKTPPEESS
jgi:4'-phosphopantetheinyl transferase EntD